VTHKNLSVFTKIHIFSVLLLCIHSRCEEHQKIKENVFHSVIVCVCYGITEDGRVGTGYRHYWKVTGIHSTESYDLVLCVTKS